MSMKEANQVEVKAMSINDEAIIEFLKWAMKDANPVYDFDRPEGHAEARKQAGWGAQS